MNTKKIGLFIRKYGNSYILIAPFFILYAIFGLYPAIYSFYLSFVKWTPAKMTFIGLANFNQMIHDSVFWTSVWNTIYLFIINVPLMTFLAIVFAYVFNDKFIKGRRVFQLIYLLPYVTGTVAAAIVFKLLFDDGYGWVNTILSSVGIPKVPWLRSERVAMWTYNIFIIWQWVGYNMMIMVGGLQGINTDLYEAAYIDGSTSIKNMFYITMPLLMPVILFALIMSTIGTFNAFTPSVTLFSNGGPGYATYTMTYYQYQQTFASFKLGYGAALSMAVFIFIAVLSIPQVVRAIRDV